jgi:hypothetical protein
MIVILPCSPTFLVATTLVDLSSKEGNPSAQRDVMPSFGLGVDPSTSEPGTKSLFFKLTLRMHFGFNSFGTYF